MSEQTDEAPAPSPSRPTPAETRKGALARLLSSIKTLVDPDLPVEDRRVAGRVDCAVEVKYLAETGESGDGTVLDISRRGLRMRTVLQIPKGMTLALKPPAILAVGNYAPLMARVMWSTRATDGYLCGLLLPPGIEDEETWLEALLASMGFASPANQRRKFVRADSDIDGRILFDLQPPIDVVVLNLGMGGALVKARQEFERNTPFRLQIGPYADLPEIEVSGSILRAVPCEGESFTLHSTRFGPLEERRHRMLKEYILKLLKKR